MTWDHGLHLLTGREIRAEHPGPPSSLITEASRSSPRTISTGSKSSVFPCSDEALTPTDVLGCLSGPGDILITPKGSKGYWRNLSPVKKFWAIFEE